MGGGGSSQVFHTPRSSPTLLIPVTLGLGGALAGRSKPVPAPDDQAGRPPYLVDQAATAGTQPRSHRPRGGPPPGRPRFPWSGWG